MQKAYFTGIRDVIRTELAAAKHDIKVAVCWVTNNELLDFLISKANEGLRVQLIVVNDSTNQVRKFQFQQLMEKGGQFYFASLTKLMHNKYCVIDNKIMITGSYNWTDSADNNEENIVVHEDPALVDAFTKNFERIRLNAIRCNGDIELSATATLGQNHSVANNSLEGNARLIAELTFGRRSARVESIPSSPSPRLNMYRTIVGFYREANTQYGKSIAFEGYFGVAYTKTIPRIQLGDAVDVEVLSYWSRVDPNQPEKGERLLAKCRLLGHE